MAAIVTVRRHKLHGGAYPTWRGGGAAGVFLEAHGQYFQEGPELHLYPMVKYPQFYPKPKKVGNYDKSLIHLR